MRMLLRALPVVVLAVWGLLLPGASLAVESKPFGIESFSMQTTEANPEGVNEPYLFTQAAGHPSALTTSIHFATEETSPNHFSTTGDPKDVIIKLPVGMVANPQAVVHCSAEKETCPTDSQVGVFELRFVGGEQQLWVLGAIYEMTPYPGQPAELGLEVPFLGRVPLTARLIRTPEGYGLALVGRGLPIANLSGIGENAPSLHLSFMETTLWGVPAAAVHDSQRGVSCFGTSNEGQLNCGGGGHPSGQEAVPFLTTPSTCPGVAESASVSVDSWQGPARYVQAQSPLSAMAYCDRLSFHPELSVRPETLAADRAVGVSVTVKVPQIEGEAALVSTPPLHAATITLPSGLSINPSVGNGQQACEADGPSGFDMPTGLNAAGEPLGPNQVGVGEEVPDEALGPPEPQLTPGHCPEASTVGTAEAVTPFTSSPVKGRVYLATPECGGAQGPACTDEDAADGRLYRLYVELGGKNGERGEGVVIKLEATVQVSPATGQLSVRLAEAPQLPISQLSLRLFGGERALLANQPTCGTATTTSDVEPWSSPYTPDASPSSYYEVTGCAASHTLTPRLIAGSVNPLAGAFSPFTFTVVRSDGEPYLSQLQLQTPAGLSAMLASVPVCGQALANSGECPTSSRIGSSLVSAGAGSPLAMPGSIYLTGPYDGSPFGLSILTHAVAGPLDLGSIVIRARVDINPHTASLAITSDRLPQIVLGVPLRLRQITLKIDRPGFILNPTNCSALQIAATIAGAEAANAQVTNPFAVGGCRGLSFKPTLKASTNGRTSYAGGAGLDLKLAVPKGDVGVEANLAQIKIALPKQLSSRLSTLQGACRSVVFEANPASCPGTSIVGVAKARSPVLSAGLTGPVYLVSHGADVFPSPVVVLQGEGVTLELQGATTVHASASSVMFRSLPDIPLQGMEIYLSQGSHSLLTSTAKLCSLRKVVTVVRTVSRRVSGRVVRSRVKVRERLPPSLPMPTSLVAQNGRVVHTGVKIEVLGCGVK
ncbi:MAG TPA: hypothetical protein VGI26_08700 [Solirubrobacteraceae bacterium]